MGPKFSIGDLVIINDGSGIDPWINGFERYIGTTGQILEISTAGNYLIATYTGHSFYFPNECLTISITEINY